MRDSSLLASSPSSLGPIRSIARLLPRLRVEAVGAVPLLLQLLARRSPPHSDVTGGPLLQPGGFGGLDLGFGLRGSRLSGRFLRKRFPPLEFGCPEPCLLANFFGLPSPTAIPAR